MKEINEKNKTEEQKEEKKNTRKGRLDELKERINRLADEMYQEKSIEKSRELRSEIIKIIYSPIWNDKPENGEKDEVEKSESDLDDDEDYGMGDKVSYFEVEEEAADLEETMKYGSDSDDEEVYSIGDKISYFEVEDETEDLNEEEEEINAIEEEFQEDDEMTEQSKDEEAASVVFKTGCYRDYIVIRAQKWLRNYEKYKEAWVDEVFDNTLNSAFDSYNPNYDKSKRGRPMSFYNYLIDNLKRALINQNVIDNKGRFIRIIRKTSTYKYSKEKNQFERKDKEISQSKDENDVYQLLAEKGNFVKIAKTYRGKNKAPQTVGFEKIFLKNGTVTIIKSGVQMLSFHGDKIIITYLKKGEIYKVIWMLKDNGKWWYILKDKNKIGWVDADLCQYSGNVIYMGEIINQNIKPGKEYTVVYNEKNPEKEMKGEMIIDLLRDPSGLWEDRWVNATDITIDEGNAIVVDKSAENFRIGDIVKVKDQIYKEGAYYYTVVKDDGVESDIRADQMEFVDGKLFIDKTDVILYTTKKSEILGEKKKVHKSLGEYTINGKKMIGKQLYYSVHNRKKTRSFDSYWVKQEDTQEMRDTYKKKDRSASIDSYGSNDKSYSDPFDGNDIDHSDPFDSNDSSKIKAAMISLINLIQQYEERKDTSPEWYKKYMRLFYTDYLFYLLRGNREISNIRKSTERNSLSSMDQGWASHVLNDSNFESFQQIRSASAKIYNDFLSESSRYESYKGKYDTLQFPVARIREKYGQAEAELRNAVGMENDAIVEIGKLIYKIYYTKTGRKNDWTAQKYHRVLNEFLEKYYYEVENIIWNGK